MSEYIIFAVAAGALASYYFLRRSQEPDRLSQVQNAFRAKSEIADAFGGGNGISNFGEMADAIARARRIIQTGEAPAEAEMDLIQIRLANATGELSSLPLGSQNNYHECYKALQNLSIKLGGVRRKSRAA
ncbi:hypothetical protein WCE37_14610 [Luteimonas sp. MJ250]|uniref:hypothetical protein n=1 Tax=Luteimonas sp. MJ250 TaxID=3129236 RepID=UPI0031BAA6F6